MRVKLNHYSATAVLACAGCAVLLCAGNARASTIIIGGTITQDTQDVGSPAVANPALNKIEDSDRFSVTLTPAGLLSSTGSYQLTSTTFLDPVRAAFESGFVSGTLVINQAGPAAQFSGLACLVNTAVCQTGNQLALNFQIPANSVNQTGVNAQITPGLLPLDLLEDGGNTDIQGSVTSYSYSASTTTIPEPSTVVLLESAAVLISLLTFRTFRRKHVFAKR